MPRAAKTPCRHIGCRACRKAGRLVAGEVIDHIQPFQSPADPLALEPGNLQTLCKPCHNAKTRRDTNQRRGP